MPVAQQSQSPPHSNATTVVPSRSSECLTAWLPRQTPLRSRASRSSAGTAPSSCYGAAPSGLRAARPPHIAPTRTRHCARSTSSQRKRLPSLTIVNLTLQSMLPSLRRACKLSRCPHPPSWLCVHLPASPVIAPTRWRQTRRAMQKRLKARCKSLVPQVTTRCSPSSCSGYQVTTRRRSIWKRSLQIGLSSSCAEATCDVRVVLTRV
mmetsp:Transcript_64511/g.127432  ORF Transcript_64511/g.127432 Transcript_64511/m.127432 type:complete len:207 (-) Transcript_64511:88-708(-)